MSNHNEDEILDINSINIMPGWISDNQSFPTYDGTKIFIHPGSLARTLVLSDNLSALSEYNLYCKYFTENEINDSEIEENEPKERASLFNVEKQENYRGRKRKRKEIIDSKLNYEPLIHSKYTSDNLLRKVQTHYMTFIIDYSNTILKKYGYWEKEDFFVNISYDFKKNVNKDNINLLKKSSIGYVLCQNISSKFKTMGNDKNIKIFKKVTENDIIKHLLSENYLKLFKDVYHKNKRIISFNIGDYFDIIDLTNTKMFEDLLKKKRNEKEDYKERLKESLNIYYIN